MAALLDRLGRPMLHGMHKSPEHRAWAKMKDRCCNPRSQTYARYGGRGIRVCRRWRSSFKNFFADMGPRPSPDHSIDRIDNDGNYCPENCRWATRNEQNSNKRTSVFLQHDGMRLTVAEWSKRLGIEYQTLRYRIASGWPVSEVLGRSVERRSWSDSKEKVDWKRRRPLGGSCMSLLQRMLDGKWRSPQELGAVPNGVVNHSLATLSRKGFIEKKPVQMWRVRNLYRISDSGREKVQQAIDATKYDLDPNACSQCHRLDCASVVAGADCDGDGRGNR